MCAAKRRMIEPLMNSRKVYNDVKTRLRHGAWEKSGGYLFTDSDGIRLRGGVNLQRALGRNAGTLPTMQRENTRWRTHRVLSTNAWARDGWVRSSGDGS